MSSYMDRMDSIMQTTAPRAAARICLDAATDRMAHAMPSETQRSNAETLIRLANGFMRLYEIGEHE